MRDVYNATSNHQLNSRKYKKFGKNYITNEKLYDVLLLYVRLYDSFSLRLGETEGNLLQHARNFLSRRPTERDLERARCSLASFPPRLALSHISLGKFLDDFECEHEALSSFPASHTLTLLTERASERETRNSRRCFH